MTGNTDYFLHGTPSPPPPQRQSSARLERDGHHPLMPHPRSDPAQTWLRAAARETAVTIGRFAKSGGNAICRPSATLRARDLNGEGRSRRDPVIWCRAVRRHDPTPSCKIPKGFPRLRVESGYRGAVRSLTFCRVCTFFLSEMLKALMQRTVVLALFIRDDMIVVQVTSSFGAGTTRMASPPA
jgi:hypothetical protein